MMRSYTICHMVTTIDGKVTGKFLSTPEAKKTEELYFELHRNFDAQGFICGRVTMEESFTHGWYPRLDHYEPMKVFVDRVPKKASKFYAVAFDPKGRLGWKKNYIEDEDPGYDRARIVEVLTTSADPRYITYLEEMDIPYIFAGKTEINVEFALLKLKTMFGINKVLLEGGSVTNGTFAKENLIDEISLTVAPVIASFEAKPLFSEGALDTFVLADTRKEADVLWLNYKKKE